MSKKPEEKLPPLEQGLLTAMRALDNQVARAMQRSPAEREEHGVQKWEPFDVRIERVCGVVLNALGDEEIQLDSLLIMAQAMAKSLGLLVDDLGHDGLGEVRSTYCAAALEAVSNDVTRALRLLKGTNEVM